MAPRSSPSGCNKQQLFNLLKCHIASEEGCLFAPCWLQHLILVEVREVALSRDSSTSPREEGRRSRAWGGQAEECERVEVQRKETGQRGIHLGSAWCWHPCLGTGRLQGPAQRGTDGSRVAAGCWVSCHGQSTGFELPFSCPVANYHAIVLQLVVSFEV